MEWVESNHLSEINTVDDFEDLMRVINDPTLTEFQYLVDGDILTVSIKKLYEENAMYAQAAIKPNPLLRNGAYGIVMRGVQK